ncbi:Bug family tripartite tricarboxylate transporter substrate binding protein [Ottowia sp.]|uniref:Bug family tripartite tricarboxylate transporter substrate binding protein n=1 Tax=Ottowia sp. TaxID=1898956 RepID=UPI0039E39A2E
MKRRFVLTAAACGLAAPYALAQPRSSRIIVAFSPGGPVDFVARSIAEKLGAELGHTVIVENKPGANGALGAAEVMRSPPDGTTLWLTSVGAAAINPALYSKLPYDMDKDFAPVSLVTNNVEVLVANPKVPAGDAADFIAWARAQPQPVSLASSGTGSIPHLAMEQFQDAGKVQMIHVPYKGAAPAITDVIGGQVSAVFLDVTAVLPYIRAGRLKPLGVAAKTRHPSLPDVKTIEEQGLAGVDSNNWYALFTHAQVPASVVAELNQAVRRTLADPAVLDKLRQSGTDPAGSSPAELRDLMHREMAKWAQLIKAKNIKAE